MTLDEYLADLAEKAEKATPGPWESVDGKRQTDNWFSAIYGPAGDYKALLIGLCNQNDAHRDDAAHIAAFSPDVAAALVAVAEAANKISGELPFRYPLLNVALNRLSDLARTR